jgi:hypothetical protein
LFICGAVTFARKEEEEEGDGSCYRLLLPLVLLCCSAIEEGDDSYRCLRPVFFFVATHMKN